MYRVSVETHFCAAHHLVGDFGKCRNQHGHDWRVRVTYEGKDLRDSGVLIDFRDIKEALEPIISALDHTDLNQLIPFKTTNPTAENLAKWIYSQIRLQMINPKEVRVYESENAYASYSE